MRQFMNRVWKKEYLPRLILGLFLFGSFCVCCSEMLTLMGLQENLRTATRNFNSAKALLEHFDDADSRKRMAAKKLETDSPLLPIAIDELKQNRIDRKPVFKEMADSQKDLEFAKQRAHAQTGHVLIWVIVCIGFGTMLRNQIHRVSQLVDKHVGTVVLTGIIVLLIIILT